MILTFGKLVIAPKIDYDADVLPVTIDDHCWEDQEAIRWMIYCIYFISQHSVEVVCSPMGDLG